MQKSHDFTTAKEQFDRGDSLRKISQDLKIPLRELTRHADANLWKQQKTEDNSLAPVESLAPSPVETEDRKAKIAANRARNLALLENLQKDLGQLAEQLASGKLIVSRVTPAGIVVKGEATLKDRVDLINYAEKIQDLTYRALGDVESAKPDTARDKSGQPNGAITLILPQIIARPRGERTAVEIHASPSNPEKPVIDLLENGSDDSV